jgi:hypothetical protein
VPRPQSRAKRSRPRYSWLRTRFVRLDIAEILRNASFRVVEAGNADEALAVLNSAYPVDALMTDIRMPGSIDGINLPARVPKKAIADYKKAIGKLEGLVELSIFYCEEAFSIIESCGMEEESYFLALIHMYDQALRLVSNLPPDIRINYVDRLDKLRSRGRHVGWGVEDELNSLWFAASLPVIDKISAMGARSVGRDVPAPRACTKCGHEGATLQAAP